MGTEAFWIPAVTALVSAGGQAYNQHDQARRQDRDLAQGIAQQSEVSQQAAQKVQQQISSEAAVNPDQQRAKAVDDYVQQLRSSKDQSETANPSVAGASSRYAADSAAASTNAAGYGKNLAALLGGIDAPGRTAAEVQRSRLNTEGQIGQLSGNASGDAYIAQLKAQGEKTNPYITLGSKLGSNYANYASTQGLGTGGSTTLNGGSGFLTKAGGASYDSGSGYAAALRKARNSAFGTT